MIFLLFHMGVKIGFSHPGGGKYYKILSPVPLDILETYLYTKLLGMKTTVC
jgi:hypothetical protein